MAVAIGDLVRRSAGGDRTAFGRVYDLTADAAWRTARGAGLGEPQAEAVLRRAYRDLWDHAGDREVQDDPRGWLLGTVHLAARGTRPL